MNAPIHALIDFCDPHGHQPALRCAFANPLHTLAAHTPEQVRLLLDAVAAHAQSGRWCVGFVRYEAATAFDAAFVVHPPKPPGTNTTEPLAWFGVFDQALPWPEPPTAPGNAPDQAPTADPTQTKVHWHTLPERVVFNAGVNRIHQAIAAGDLYQVNHTAALHGHFQGDPVELFARLHRAQPNGYSAFIDTGSSQVLSVSPELFFDWQGQHILTRPMKGTAPRGTTPAQDQALAAELASTPKERAENVMIVDLLRNDLSRIAQPHTVKVPTLFKVQTLPTVFQMVSDVTATTRAHTSLADVFAALFPCGSITGAPKVQAMRMIAELEAEPRGVYCGAIGVVRPGGHATFNVAIRTVTLQGNHATCGLGSGITFDATAAAEWQEWQHKQRFLHRASQSFDLLETLRLEDGAYQHLPEHLARLSAAAAHFATPYDEHRVRAALQSLAQTRPQGTWRVRLLLDAQGTPKPESYEQKGTPAHVVIGLAAMPFEEHLSEFTRFKTTRRAHYDAFAPQDPALFDTLLYNPRGELTECTRGNIALLLDGQWVTPALHCGLLGGVGREVFLKNGRLSEAVVHLSDLPRVKAMAFINSLRGWVDASLRSEPTP